MYCVSKCIKSPAHAFCESTLCSTPRNLVAVLCRVVVLLDACYNAVIRLVLGYFFVLINFQYV